MIVVVLFPLLLATTLLSSSVIGSDICWDVTDRTCKINAKFHTTNQYDVHIKCTAEDDGRDSGDRFQKVYHAELNGCLTFQHTNPFELLPRNMNNLRKLTLNQFHIGILSIDASIAPHLPKLEELILKDNVIYAYASDFFAAKSIRQLKSIEFAGPLAITPALSQLESIPGLQTLVVRQGDLLVNYETLASLENLNSLEIYSSNVTATDADNLARPAGNATGLHLSSLTLEDSHLTNTTLQLIGPLENISYLRIKNTTDSGSAALENDLLNVTQILIQHPQLTSLSVTRQNLSRLTLDLQQLIATKLKLLDVSYNDLGDIEGKWDAQLAKVLIETNGLRIVINNNPWDCSFFQNVDQDLFEYEKDYNLVNVRGLNCRHNSTKGSHSNHLSNRPLDLNNMWLLYGTVLSSLMIIISLAYVVCAICRRNRKRRREPFYRSLLKWNVNTSPMRKTEDLNLRKLPATNYETPLQYRTIEFKSEDNCEIYEEIPANPKGQTIQVIV